MDYKIYGSARNFDVTTFEKGRFEETKEKLFEFEKEGILIGDSSRGGGMSRTRTVLMGDYLFRYKVTHADLTPTDSYNPVATIWAGAISSNKNSPKSFVRRLEEAMGSEVLNGKLGESSWL